MRLTYDPSTRAVYVYIQEGVKIAISAELILNKVLIDYSEDGSIVGLDLTGVEGVDRIEMLAPNKEAQDG